MVLIKPTVFDISDAPVSYKSYTLPNTPFYLKIDWDNQQELANNFQILWNFGDGTTFVGPSAEYFYKYPGVYNVTATVYDNQGIAYTLPTIILSAFNAMPDKIIFTTLSNSENYLYTLKAGKRSLPLEIHRYNSWQNDSILKENGYTINFYASGSKSDFFSVADYYKNKWAHLRKYFGFVELELGEDNLLRSKLIDSTNTNAVSVYAEKTRFPTEGPNFDIQLKFYNKQVPNTSFIGTTGSSLTKNKSVHFIDQTPNSITNDSIVFIFAAPDTIGYPDRFGVENNLFNDMASYPYGYINYPATVQPVKSLFNPAEYIAFSSNGITSEGITVLDSVTAQELLPFDIYPVKWTNTKIPFTITFKDLEKYTTKCYPPITGFRTDGELPVNLNTVSFGLFKYVDLDPFSPGVILSSVNVVDFTISQNERAPKLQNSGSYFCGLLELSEQTKNVYLTACAFIKDEPAIRNNYATGFLSQLGQNNFYKYSKRPIYSNCFDQLQITYTAESFTFPITGGTNFGISVAPINANFENASNIVYVTNADQDTISIFNTDGNLLFYFNLSAISFYNGEFTLPVIKNLKGDLDSAAPAYVAIDSTGDGWITLSDNVIAIKIDRITYLVSASAVPDLTNVSYIDSNLYTSLSAQLSGFVGENSLIPTCAETDLNNNLWVGYSHPVSGFMMKYSTTGTLLSVFPFAPAYSIQEIIVTKNDDIWASVVNLNDRDKNLADRNDLLFKWDKFFNLYPNFPITNIKGIGSITIDLNQNVWFNSNRNNLTRVSPDGVSTSVIIGSFSNNTEYIQSFGAIGADTENFIWLADNFQGKLWLYNPSNVVDGTVLPLSALSYADLTNISLVVSGMPAFYNTMGDWTGVRWLNKYLNAVNTTPRYIYGKSNLFDVLSSSYFINKKNENFDQAATYKSYLLQESLYNNTNLWDNFMGQIVGDYNSSPTTLGKKIYEKISNFVSNNSDPDVCNIDSLKSLFQQYGLSLPTFSVEYPPDLKRVIDLLSINQGKLFGNPNKYNRNFFDNFTGEKGPNLGDEIDLETGTFLAGEPIVTYELFSEKFNLITNTLILISSNSYAPSGSIIPLSGINYYWGWNLVTGNKAQSGLQIKPYYKFYKYRDYRPDNIVDSVIDFDNPLTTIAYTNSGYDDWIKYGGNIDKILGFTMYKGLKIIP